MLIDGEIVLECYCWSEDFYEIDVEYFLCLIVFCCFENNFEDCFMVCELVEEFINYKNNNDFF